MTSNPKYSAESSNAPFRLDGLPPIYILPTHLGSDEVDDLEDRLTSFDAPLTYDTQEARIFLTRIGKKRRAQLELRARDLWTEEVLPAQLTPARSTGSPGEPPQKRRKLLARDESTVSEASEDDAPSQRTDSTASLRSRSSDLQKDIVDETEPSSPPRLDDGAAAGPEKPADDFVRVVTVSWLHACIDAGRCLPLDDHVIYIGSITSKPSKDLNQVLSPSKAPKTQETSTSIMQRALADATTNTQKSYIGTSPLHARHKTHTKPSLLPRSTTGEDSDSQSLPELPEWVTQNALYACQRRSPLYPPNEEFIASLLKIKRARLLSLDEIGVRAYSTAIASIIAYPHKLTSSLELLRLPGCEKKVAALFEEWNSHPDHLIAEVQRIESDPDFKILQTFYDIWGVGAHTARELYYTKGWRDLDDIIEFGWNDLSRVQQIGVKYYDEFLAGIPRAEVETISKIICTHASNIRPDADFDGKGMECITVGGYRRGKETCGDVDFILTHRDERVTADLITDVVEALEKSGYITHTLSLHTGHSERGQTTIPPRHGSGPQFDSLDKALVVWQDPEFEDGDDDDGDVEEGGEGKKKRKNPNPHRRVDIIISPWRTIGCGILGWSGDTTFERDIRRWAQKKHNWKFDSTGLTERGTGRVIDLESKRSDTEWDTGEDTWEARERRVMEGLGLEWRPPGERCTR